MITLLELPSIDDAPAFHLRRRAEGGADPARQRLPDRIATNRFGHIVLMPAPGFSHSTRPAEIFARRLELLPQVRALPEGAILTSDGVKGVELAWISEARIKRGLKGEVLTIAPEIGVEVISPSNPRQELESKRDLSFEAGAEDLWFCDRKGALHFSLKGGGVELKTSALCPAMPRRIQASTRTPAAGNARRPGKRTPAAGAPPAPGLRHNPDVGVRIEP